MARTEIIIGGKLPAMLLQEFLDSVGSTGAKVGRHDGEAFVAKTAEQLRQVLDENWHLRPRGLPGEAVRRSWSASASSTVSPSTGTTMPGTFASAPA